MSKIYKTCNESRLVHTLGLLPRDLNHSNILYGGKLLDILDNISGTVAIKHSESSLVTASVDSIDFIKGAKKGDLLYAESYVSGVGNRSIEVFTKFLGNTTRTGEVFFVAIGFTTFTITQDKSIPKILPESEEEKNICSGYIERKELNLLRINRTKEILKFSNCDMIWK